MDKLDLILGLFVTFCSGIIIGFGVCRIMWMLTTHRHIPSAKIKGDDILLTIDRNKNK